MLVSQMNVNSFDTEKFQWFEDVLEVLEGMKIFITFSGVRK